MTQSKNILRNKDNRSHSCAQLKTDHFSGSVKYKIENKETTFNLGDFADGPYGERLNKNLFRTMNSAPYRSRGIKKPVIFSDLSYNGTDVDVENNLEVSRKLFDSDKVYFSPKIGRNLEQIPPYLLVKALKIEKYDLNKDDRVETLYKVIRDFGTFNGTLHVALSDGSIIKIPFTYHVKSAYEDNVGENYSRDLDRSKLQEVANKFAVKKSNQIMTFDRNSGTKDISSMFNAGIDRSYVEDIEEPINSFGANVVRTTKVAEKTVSESHLGADTVIGEHRVLSIETIDTNKAPGDYLATMRVRYADGSEGDVYIPYTITGDNTEEVLDNTIFYYTWDSDNKRELLEELKSLGFKTFLSNDLFETYIMMKNENSTYGFDSITLEDTTVLNYFRNNGTLVNNELNLDNKAIVDFLSLGKQNKYLFGNLKTILKIDKYIKGEVEASSEGDGIDNKDVLDWIKKYISYREEGLSIEEAFEKLKENTIGGIFGSPFMIPLSLLGEDYYNLKDSLNDSKLSRIEEISNYTKESFNYIFDEDRSIIESGGSTFKDIYFSDKILENDSFAPYYTANEMGHNRLRRVVRF